MPYHELAREPLARLVGARPGEVVAMNTLTVNLHLLFVSFYLPSATRHRIVIEKPAFPSDRYAVVSQIELHGRTADESLVELETEDAIGSFLKKEGESVALVWLSGVNYYSGEAFDMKRVTKLAHAKRCLVGFDLAHAVGNVPREPDVIRAAPVPLYNRFDEVDRFVEALSRA